MANGVTDERVTGPVAEAMDFARLAAERLRHQTTDLFLPPEARLSDRQRALWTNLLVGLIDSLEIELRQGMIEAARELPAHGEALKRGAIGEFPHSAAGHIYDEGPTLRDPELIDLIRRRAEEHRMALKLGGRNGTHSADDIVIRLIRSSDPEISRLTMEMLVADSRRLDRFREPMLHVADLPPGIAEDIIWWTAAALRRHLVETVANVEALLVPAAHRLIAEREGMQDDETATMAVALRLAENSELDDQLLIDALRAGRIGLFVSGLAVRGGVARSLVWTLVEWPSGGLPRYLKAIGIEREAAVRILVEVTSLTEEMAGRGAPDSIGVAIGQYDRMEPVEARKILDYWRTDARLRNAIEGRFAP